MKRKIFAALTAAVLVLCFSACNKLGKDLSGTKWQYQVTVGTVQVTSNLNFIDKTNFELSISGNDKTETAKGTYTYADKKGILTVTTDAGASIPFTYDSKNNTITCSCDLLGTGSAMQMVFNQVK